jgi:hypothetical protein
MARLILSGYPISHSSATGQSWRGRVRAEYGLPTRSYGNGFNPESPNPATEVINDTELQDFVKKTLTITGFS